MIISAWHILDAEQIEVIMAYFKHWVSYLLLQVLSDDVLCLFERGMGAPG